MSKTKKTAAPSPSNLPAWAAWLRQEIDLHNYLYYVEARPEITDKEFDQLLK